MPQKAAYRPTPTNPNTPAEPQPAASMSKIAEHTDELLDDIDACLEENALEVVRAYVQRSGQ